MEIFTMKTLWLVLFLFSLSACGPSYQVREVLQIPISDKQLEILNGKIASGIVKINEEEVIIFDTIRSRPIRIERDYPSLGFVGGDNIYRVYEFVPIRGQTIHTFGMEIHYKK